MVQSTTRAELEGVEWGALENVPGPFGIAMRPLNSAASLAAPLAMCRSHLRETVSTSPATRFAALALITWAVSSCADSDRISPPGTAPDQTIPGHIERVPLAFHDRNSLPDTFFDIAPPDPTFSNEVHYRWLGTDLDGDVMGFGLQFVEVDSLYYMSAGASGTILRSIDPPSPSATDRWRHVFENFMSYSDLSDGWYECRVRALDDKHGVDPSPAKHRFFLLFDDVSPHVEILAGCGRLNGATATLFLVTANDSSRTSQTPRGALEYQAQLRAQGSPCTQHLADPFDALAEHDPDGDHWGHFPEGGDPIAIGDSPPFL